MCGRFEVLTAEEIASVIEAVEGKRALRLADARPAAGGDSTQARVRAQARPGNTVPLIAPSAAGALSTAEAVWGFEAPWNNRQLVFNTRIESALSGAAMWRGAIDDGRCIVPAASFYEPHATETEPNPHSGRQAKRQYRFVDENGAPLLLAGVQANGRCSIVTCEPNRWVAPIHHRMPLALRFEEVATWLSPDWPALADRSAYGLVAEPERLGDADNPEGPTDSEPPHQLSLF